MIKCSRFVSYPPRNVRSQQATQLFHNNSTNVYKGACTSKHFQLKLESAGFKVRGEIATTKAVAAEKTATEAAAAG